ncbi:MAG: peptidase domain-containing ABC transporter [Sphingomonas bacterium]
MAAGADRGGESTLVRIAGIAALRFGRSRIAPVVRQDEATECGLACLAMIAGSHGYDVDLISLRRRFAVSLKGLTLRTLLRFAEEIQLNSRAVKAEIDDLPKLSLPAILHWNFSHFVVLADIAPRSKRPFLIHDPATGPGWKTEAELSRHFTGVAVEFEPGTAFRTRRERSKLALWQLWARTRGLGAALGQTFLLSAIMQIFLLASPFFLQISVDTVIPASDKDLLTVLALGFVGLTLLNLATSALRSLALVSLGNQLGYQLVSNLFRRMIRLPMAWFEKRSTGEVLTRFNSTQPIVDLITHGLVSTLIDGGMAVLTLILMAIYSPVLASVSVAALVAYMVLRLSYFSVMRSRNVGVVVAQAREQSVLIETIRGMVAIKLFGRESDRQRLWENRRVDYVNAQIGVARLQAVFDVGNSAVTGLENIAFVYLSVRMIIDGHFTVGMMYAFSAYKQQFLTAGLNVVGKIADYKMLDVHLNRVADIALSEKEEMGTPDGDSADRPRGALTLRNIAFTYGRGDAAVLRDVNLSIRAGETVAIVGASGSGKTTLLKIALGLLQPTRGEVLVDGQRLQSLGLAFYRRNVAAVMQDDVLYAGSIAENIAFFDASIDMDRVIAAALAAIVHDEILAMPMGYESMVGDMGSALSGGQKQRVLLARALYHQPAILFMDEGTAHLDVDLERAVSASLRAMSITRVLVAHRPETIRSADRVVEIEDGVARVRTRSSRDGDLKDQLLNAFGSGAHSSREV